MRHTTTLVLVGLMLSSAATPALAQRRRTTTRTTTRTTVRARVPDTGMIAVGGSIGLTLPRSAFLDKGLDIAGNVESYLSPRLSIRGQVGTAWWDMVGLRYTGTMQPLFLLGNVVYNWEGGKIHPYVTGGGGLYHYAFDETGVTGSLNKPGIDFGGGVEYFFTRYATITGEGLLHAVGTVPTNRATAGFKGSFWSFNAGVKKYFK